MTGLKADIAAGRPPSPAEEARAIQDVDERLRREAIDRGVAEAEERRRAGSIPGN